MSYKANSYNFFDETPMMARDLVLINHQDQEEFLLFGSKAIYYKIKNIQHGYDSVYRDFLTSPEFEEPIETRCHFKIDEETTHGMTEIGSGQVAERQGNIYFNITMLEEDLGRVPVLGDIIFNRQANQVFQIFTIAKCTYRLGRPIRYHITVKLYQDSL